MTVQHRFECVHCGHPIRATGPDSEAARQAAREQGAAHVNDAHVDRLAESVHWPDELAPDDLLSDDAAYGALRGWLAPADELLICGDCGYYFGREDEQADRQPVGDAGLVCTACYARRVERHRDSVSGAIEEFVR
jgi:DNA-directed RNA polymerase subunit RPC12/RpoP